MKLIRTDSEKLAMGKFRYISMEVFKTVIFVVVIRLVIQMVLVGTGTQEHSYPWTGVLNSAVMGVVVGLLFGFLGWHRLVSKNS